MNRVELRAHVDAHVAMMTSADVEGIVFVGSCNVTEFTARVTSEGNAALLLKQLRVVIDDILTRLPPTDEPVLAFMSSEMEFERGS